MSQTLSLTPEQQAAVDTQDGAFLLVAPPGSGKTEVLARRIARLLGESRGQAFRVLGLTFTNRAAESLRSRVGQDAAGEERRLFAGTFHSFCLDVLRNHGEPVNVGPDTAVYETDDERLTALHDGLRADGLDPKGAGLDEQALRNLLRGIDRLRADVIEPTTVDEVASNGVVPITRAHNAYTRLLERNHALDFAEMLQRTHQLLTQDDWTRRHYARLYRYVHVDEAQDCSPIQYAVLRALCDGPSANIFVVADPKQSIYRFAGASPGLLDGLCDELGATRLELTSNFRSARSIVTLANALARHFADPAHVVEMASHGSAEGFCELVPADDEEHEAAAVAAWVDDLCRDDLPPAILEPGEDPRISAEQVAVLARTRFSLPAVAEQLDRRGIGSVLRTGGQSYLTSALGELVLDLLRVASNPADGLRRRRLQRQLVAREAVAHYDNPAELPELLEGADERLPRAIRDLFADYPTHTNDDELLRALTRVTVSELSDPDEILAWDQDVQELGRCWSIYASRAPDTRSLSGFLGQLARLQRATVEEAGVRLLTVHAAKGLEFRAVAVIGLNDGLFPHSRSRRTPSEIEEERRNVYVAITRPARWLRLSRPLLRTTRSGPYPQSPSPFLAEMGIPTSDRN